MSTLSAMFKLYDGYSTTIQKVTKNTDRATDKILNASGATDKFSNKLKNIGASASTANGGLARLAKTALSIATLFKGIDIADSYTNTNTRIGLLTDTMDEQLSLQNQIFAAAERAKGSYSSMADVVAKMGILAKENFSSNSEIVAFTELLQKSFKISGASTSEQQSALLQLSQAMAAGKLQGDEFRSIMENAPMLADAIAKYTGKTKGELKTMSAEGTITADIIKNALFSSADDINGKFEQMPYTFADIWTRIKNGGIKAFSTLFVKVNQLINTDNFNKFVNGIILGFNLAAKAIGILIDTIIEKWNIISPILNIIASVYLAAIIVKLWAMIPPLIAQAAAWLAVYWPVLLIIGVIAAAIAAARHLGASWEQIFNFVGGVIGVFAANFYNIFAYMWNAVAMFINFLGNVFNNPIASIKALFYDLAVNVLGLIETMAKGIEDLLNNIPGIDLNITSGITSLKDKLANKSASIKDEAGLKEYVKTKDFIQYSEGWTKGSQIGNDIYNNISDGLEGLTNIMSDKGTPSAPTVIEGLGSNGDVNVNMSDDDMKYLRDIAERDFINQFKTSTLAPNINVQFGDVRETADVNKVASVLTTLLQEQIAISAEGSY